ncbi:MAG TPA: Clp protease N-terminal domain-containing protein [Terriglobales bacterium]|nr:Clp protease N-terminal domain-containing protein [Terriglobales bacterium]
MFDRYNEKARKTIFYARMEAGDCGAASIATEHLLLGMLRADTVLANTLLKPDERIEDLRGQIHALAGAGEALATSVEMQLSDEGERALSVALDEADRHGHSAIGTEHLLLGLMQQEGSRAAVLLTERGMTLEQAREFVSALPAG